MFRDHETGYLIASVILVYILTGLGIWYEIAYGESETVGQHLVSFGQAAGSAISTTLIILGTFEVIMVFAERYRRRRFNEGREEGRKERDAEWSAWMQRREDARRNNLPFDEPSPSERDSGQS